MHGLHLWHLTLVGSSYMRWWDYSEFAHICHWFYTSFDHAKPFSEHSKGKSFITQEVSNRSTNVCLMLKVVSSVLINVFGFKYDACRFYKLFTKSKLRLNIALFQPNLPRHYLSSFLHQPALLPPYLLNRALSIFLPITITCAFHWSFRYAPRSWAWQTWRLFKVTPCHMNQVQWRPQLMMSLA